MNGWTPTIDRKTQHMNHIAACREFVRENPNNEYWREQLERLGADLHPADEAYLLDRADSETEREEAEIESTILPDSEDGRNPIEDKQIRQIFGKVKVTTTAEWRKRHVNQTQEEVDVAKQNWKNISGESEKPQG